ncbi:helicase-exonuclease AddAB subunit AddA [Peptostreptococcaceae bacterium AGR-M142]
MVKWTNKQEEAIKTRDKNLLISAAAGSGKTAVLVERIVNLIIDKKIDITSFLIVTFTNAAAGEMRERIQNRILKELESTEDEELFKFLKKQLTLVSKAQISTIHSFCINVIRKNFHLLDIDPSFKIGDILECNLLKKEALDDLFEIEYEKENEYFYNLIEMFSSNKTDEDLKDLILNMYLFIQSKPYPFKWLKEALNYYKLDYNTFLESKFYEVLENEIKSNLQNALYFIKKAKSLACDDEFMAYKENLIDDEELINSYISNLNDFKKLKLDIENNTFKRLKRVSKEADENLKEEIKSLRDDAKDIIKKTYENYFLKDIDLYIKDINLIKDDMFYLNDLIVEFNNLYKEKKLDKNILDFNDLEHLAIEILSQEAPSIYYKDKFNYIFVDEYQDSNLVQETLIDFIKREDNLFMVGDVKQSIYKFRLADPSIFVQRYLNYKTDNENLNIDLSNNFRSRKNILKSTNYIFKHIMKEEFCGFAYDEDSYLYEGREFKEIESEDIEINLIEKSKSKNEEESESEINIEDIKIEANLVAKKIKNLLKEKIYDDKIEDYRYIEQRDIVILMRSIKNNIDDYVEVLYKEGIDVFADINEGYFENIEIKIFLNLLRLIDNKNQDIPLISVLKSNIFDFSLEEIALIRIFEDELKEDNNSKEIIDFDILESDLQEESKETLKDKKYSFYELLEIYKDKKNDELSNKIKIFFDKLDEFEFLSRTMNLDEFIWHLFNETNYYNYMGILKGGKLRQANLDKLLNYAKEYKENFNKGLFDFIKFVERINKSRSDIGPAKVLNEEDNLVRIMSIHKSKGLEFPVVILSNIGKQFNNMDLKDDILMHKDFGIGVKYVNLQSRSYRDTLFKKIIKNKIKMENLAEEMRILYVAMTRAKDKMLLIGLNRNLTESIKKWQNGVNDYYLKNSKTFLDFLMFPLLKDEDIESLLKEKEINLLKDESKWKINLYSKEEIYKDIDLESQKEEELKDKILNSNYDDEKFFDMVRTNINWEYKNNINIPIKTTVTKLKEIKNKDIKNIYNSSKIKKELEFDNLSISGARIGTINHLLMQNIDFYEDIDENILDKYIEQLLIKDFIKEEEIPYINKNNIINFFNSNMIKRIRNSKFIKKEAPFNLKRDVDDDFILIQGIIDLYFYEDDYIVLIDYKNDRLDNLSAFASLYKEQIYLYREALERLTNKQVKESYIYSFYNNEFIKIN